jgi:hypothetical protein
VQDNPGALHHEMTRLEEAEGEPARMIGDNCYAVDSRWEDIEGVGDLWAFNARGLINSSIALQASIGDFAMSFSTEHFHESFYTWWVLIELIKRSPLAYLMEQCQGLQKNLVLRRCWVKPKSVCLFLYSIRSQDRTGQLDEAVDFTNAGTSVPQWGGSPKAIRDDKRSLL